MERLHVALLSRRRRGGRGLEIAETLGGTGVRGRRRLGAGPHLPTLILDTGWPGERRQRGFGGDFCFHFCFHMQAPLASSSRQFAQLGAIFANFLSSRFDSKHVSACALLHLVVAKAHVEELSNFGLFFLLFSYSGPWVLLIEHDFGRNLRLVDGYFTMVAVRVFKNKTINKTMLLSY